MKSLDGVNKKNDVNNTASEAPEKNVKTESEKIDFSKVKVEPLFEEFVDFDTFSKSDFRAVKVKECVAVPKSKKLLQFTLDDGTGTDRTILSGIHSFYEPEELVGKTLIAITNLPPRAMMGIDSCGMLLSAIPVSYTHLIKTEARYTTIDELFDLWANMKRGLKNNTFENYKYCLLYTSAL